MFKKNLSQSLLFLFLAIVLFFTMVPFIWVIFNSFKTNREIFAGGRLLPQTFNLNNYRFAWNEGSFNEYFLSSILSTAGIVLLRIFSACPAGYAFAKLSARRIPGLFYIFLFGMTIPMQAFIISLFYQLKAMQLINTLWGFVLAITFTGVPFSIFLMRNYFLDLPGELMESAQIDGAGTLRIFLRIMLPLAQPGILVVAVLSFLDGWNEYMLSILVLITRSVKTIPLGLIKFTGDHVSNFGAVFAGTMLAILPSIVIYTLLQKTFISGLTSGALKG
jgi:ABC-type glycerol-3-phosphate transport system permease component